MGLMLHSGAGRIGREDLLKLPAPDSTHTHTVIPHCTIVEKTLDALDYRKISVIKDEYGVTNDGSRMFGVLTLDIERDGVNLVLALRNSHDKSFSLGMVAGFRVLCCDNLAFRGEFFAIAKRHSKNLLTSVDDVLSIGVDRVQRNFQPMVETIDVWKDHSLPTNDAKAIIYDAVLGAVDMPKHLLGAVNSAYFEPKNPEFEPRNLWSLQNAFTGAFKALDPLPMYRATSSLGEYFDTL